MKKLLLPVLIFACLLSGCSLERNRPYQYTDYTVFDTVTTILGYGESEEAFRAVAQKICGELQKYHRLFDIYHDYPGINNLKTVNDQAGVAPVQVEQPILDLLKDCKTYYELTGARVNAAMGSLLLLWHEARETALQNPDRAAIPSEADRTAAMAHCSMENLILDFEEKTVFLKDPEMRLDVGAIAKGWAAQQVSRTAPAGLLISVGGNVCATGPKPDGSPWVVGVQNPDGGNYLRTLPLSGGSAVTSGDYQRYFDVEGKRYHHIIDPDTGLPGDYFRSVTVLCPDSGLADALSTALFLLPQSRGQQLLEKAGAEAMWVDLKGEIFSSSGFPKEK